MDNFKDFVRGEIKVKVESLEIERFINIATKNKIRMWDINKESFTTITFTMFQDQYKYLKRIVRKTSSKIKVTKKNGIRFLIDKVFKRKFFLFGIIIFLLLMFVFSSLILRIEIIGNKKIDNVKIMKQLEKQGITYGKLKFGMRLREAEDNILKEFDEVSIITIKIIGTKAIVNVVERNMPPNIEGVETPSDIVAIKEGVVSKITALKGQDVIRVGDYVKKGDMLISGIVKDSLEVPITVVHSKGEVLAKTWYQAEDRVDFNYKEEKFTGEEKIRNSYSIFNKTISLNGKIKFKKYDRIKEEQNVEVLGFKLPIKKTVENYREKVVVQRKLTEAEALTILRKKVDGKSKGLIPKEGIIVEKQESKEVTSTGINLKVTYIVEENIGENKEISPQDIQQEEKEESKENAQ